MKILFIDMSTKLQTINDLQTQARGGMVSSLFAISDGLSQLGHNTMVISDIKETGETSSGTRWINQDDYDGEEFDYLICNRGVGMGYPNVRAKRRILWTHDLPHNGFIPRPEVMNAYSGVVYMSQYAKKIWHTFYPTLSGPKSFLIPNGVNKELFYPREKDPNYLIYCSAPNRGTDRLALIYAATKTKLDLPIKMRAYTSMAKLHPNEGTDEGYALNYKTCEEAGVKVLDPIPQAQLAEELGRAGAMVLPTIYPEICSNIILQSLASGTPIFTTGNLGSAPEWIRHGKNGMFTQYQPFDYMVYQMEMVRNLVNVLSNPRVHRNMMNKAAQTKGIYTWKQVVNMWNKMLNRLS
jgi:glycosyltransferase involved in cell wall biosynthesis